MYLSANISLLLALFVTLAGSAIIAAQLIQGKSLGLNIIKWAQILCSVFLIYASGVLLYALSVPDFTLEYVASYTERDLPIFYRLTAFWAGQAGSLLFWALMVSVCGTFFLCTRSWKELSDSTKSWFLVFLLFIQAFFALLLSTWSNPFIMQSPAPMDGNGLNPLLQNPGMIFHPPLLFLGYGGFVIPGCLALAQALTTGKDDRSWISIARPFTLTGWLFLSAGIILGAWWAYMELGWGGYWAWDPVENASLVPWLIGTAALHTGMLEQRRTKLHRTNIFLMSLTTVSAFFATWLVRGNVVNSVHGYGAGNVGPYFLTFVILFFIIISIVSFSANKAEDKDLLGIETKEGFVVLTAWVLIALSIVILLATLWPVISRIWSANAVGLDASFYNRVCLPLFTLVLGLLFICPWMRWEGKFQDWRKFLLSCLCFCIVLPTFWYFGNTKALPLMSASLAVTVIFSMIFLLIDKGTYAVKNSLMACLVHIGLALIALGISFSGPYKEEVEMELAEGNTASVGGYTVTLNKLSEGEAENYIFLDAELILVRKGNTVGTLHPQRRLYNKFQRSSFSEAATYPSLGSEFYATLLGLNEGKAVLRMSTHPLVNWIWIGGVILVLSPLLGLSSKRKKKAESSQANSKKRS